MNTRKKGCLSSQGDQHCSNLSSASNSRPSGASNSSVSHLNGDISSADVNMSQLGADPLADDAFADDMSPPSLSSGYLIEDQFYVSQNGDSDSNIKEAVEDVHPTHHWRYEHGNPQYYLQNAGHGCTCKRRTRSEGDDDSNILPGPNSMDNWRSEPMDVGMGLLLNGFGSDMDVGDDMDSYVNDNAHLLEYLDLQRRRSQNNSVSSLDNRSESGIVQLESQTSDEGEGGSTLVSSENSIVQNEGESNDSGENDEPLEEGISLDQEIALAESQTQLSCSSSSDDQGDFIETDISLTHHGANSYTNSRESSCEDLQRQGVEGAEGDNVWNGGDRLEESDESGCDGQDGDQPSSSDENEAGSNHVDCFGQRADGRHCEGYSYAADVLRPQVPPMPIRRTDLDGQSSGANSAPNSLPGLDSAHETDFLEMDFPPAPCRYRFRCGPEGASNYNGASDSLQNNNHGSFHPDARHYHEGPCEGRPYRLEPQGGQNGIDDVETNLNRFEHSKTPKDKVCISCGFDTNGQYSDHSPCGRYDNLPGAVGGYDDDDSAAFEQNSLLNPRSPRSRARTRSSERTLSGEGSLASFSDTLQEPNNLDTEVFSTGHSSEQDEELFNVSRQTSTSNFDQDENSYQDASDELVCSGGIPDQRDKPEGAPAPSEHSEDQTPGRRFPRPTRPYLLQGCGMDREMQRNSATWPRYHSYGDEDIARYGAIEGTAGGLASRLIHGATWPHLTEDESPPNAVHLLDFLSEEAGADLRRSQRRPNWHSSDDESPLSAVRLLEHDFISPVSSDPDQQHSDREEHIYEDLDAVRAEVQAIEERRRQQQPEFNSEAEEVGGHSSETMAELFIINLLREKTGHVVQPCISSRLLVDKVMIWSEYEAYVLQVKQIGTSACGATSVINILKAFQIYVDKTAVCQTIQTNLRDECGDLVQYLVSRSVAGTTAEQLINGVIQLTDGAVYGRFFHFHPERDLEVRKWLGQWIKKGAVPLLTLNLQKGVPPGCSVPDAWHHQMAYGVGPKGIYLTNPLQVVPEEVVRQQLSSDSVLLVRRHDVIYRWRPSVDLSTLACLEDPRWRTMNVLGQVVNVMREHRIPRMPGFRPQLTHHITIPAWYRPGITLFVKKDSEAYKELISAPDIPLLREEKPG